MTNEEFLNFVGPSAYEIELTRGYPMEALLTQVHLETGGLKHYPAGSNNVLGIKAPHGAPPGTYVEVPTREFIDGAWITVMDKFQKFPSVTACLNGWADLMSKSWYRQAHQYRGDWPAFLALIWYDGQRHVYATDPMYLWKAVQRAADVGIPQWCVTCREKQQHRPVTLIIDGQAHEGYRNVSGRVEGALRPLLEIIRGLGGMFEFDWATNTLTVTRPRPWWSRLLP